MDFHIFSKVLAWWQVLMDKQKHEDGMSLQEMEASLNILEWLYFLDAVCQSLSFLD